MESKVFDNFEEQSVSVSKYDYLEKLELANKYFGTKVNPEKGVYGVNIIDKGDGWIQKSYRNENGRVSSDYYFEGALRYNRTKLDNGKWCKTLYDDNQIAYLKETTFTDKYGIKHSNINLAPGQKIVKGNFSSTIDEYGRPILNEVKNARIKNMGRESLSDKLRDSSYKKGDQRGHIIADSLGGTATKENIVAQMEDVNKSKMAQVENIVREHISKGEQVDFKVKTNYIGTNTRPSSFEPIVTVNGKDIELPNELKKIYNNGEKTNISKTKTIIGEKIGLHHEAGIKDGTTAAMITAAILTVDNVSLYINGDISAEEMAIDIAKGTAEAGVMGYSEGFIRTAVANTMQKSSHQLIKSLGKSNVPAAVISFGVTSFDTVVDYAQGEIDSQELAYDLGENVAGVTGSTVGFVAAGAAGAKLGAAAGAVAGTVAPGVGNVVGGVVGTGVGLVGGMVGYAIATEAYVTAVDVCAEYGDAIIETVEDFATDVGTVAVETGQQIVAEVQELSDKAQEIAADTIKMAEEFGEDVVNNVKVAIANFNIENALPW